MPTPIFAMVVDGGPPYPQKFYLYTERAEAVIAAVRETLYAIRKANVMQGPVVVEDFLEAATGEQWQDAYSLMSRVRRALSVHGLPIIEVKRMDAANKGEIDDQAVAHLAMDLLLNFRTG